MCALSSEPLVLEFAGHLALLRWHKRMVVIFEGQGTTGSRQAHIRISIVNGGKSLMWGVLVWKRS